MSRRACGAHFTCNTGHPGRNRRQHTLRYRVVAMWIVRLALQRPYTFIVLAIVIMLLGVFSILRTPTDIFPNINIPVVAAVWKYTGLSPEEMAERLVLQTERAAQTTVNDVEHAESQNLTGTSVVKYFFQPNVNEELSSGPI